MAAGRRVEQLARIKDLEFSNGVMEQTRQPEPASNPLAELPGAFPIGVEADGRTVLLYLATDVATDAFRSFLQGHAALLRVAPTWTLRIAFSSLQRHAATLALTLEACQERR